MRLVDLPRLIFAVNKLGVKLSGWGFCCFVFSEIVARFFGSVFEIYKIE